ncbi:MAG: hypothetical protein AB2693_23400, partial [Candidatus Thiodiazotropha sp.]
MCAISQGQVNFSYDNVFQSVRPKKIVIGFVNSRAVAGSYSLSPWNFAGYDLNQISVSVDGIPVHGNVLKMNFGSNTGADTVSALLWLLKASGKWMNDEGNAIERDDIAGGFALYAFDLEPTFEEGGYISLIKQGNVRIDAQFNSGLPHPVTCV